MAFDDILSGDIRVHYTNDSGGDKQIRWTGSATGTRTINELYSALQDLFDDVTGGVGDQMAEGIPISAQTPTQYTIGRIETNDEERAVKRVRHVAAELSRPMFEWSMTKGF